MARLLLALQHLSRLLGRHGVVEAPAEGLHAAVDSLSQFIEEAEGLSGSEREAVCRELEKIGWLLYDAPLQAIMAASGTEKLPEPVFRVVATLDALSSSLKVAASLSSSGHTDERAATALLRAACLLTGSGRLALAATGQHGGSLPMFVHPHAVESHIQAARAAAAVIQIADMPAGLLAAACMAFPPADTAAWLQLLTSGLLALCMGGPMAAEVDQDRAFRCMSHHAFTCVLLLRPEFGAVPTAIAEHAVLPAFLARQMLEHTLPAAVDRLEAAPAAVVHAAASQAPATLPQAWQLAVTALRVLFCPQVLPAAQPYLRRHQPAVLRLAERLIAALPLQTGQEDKFLLGAWCMAPRLLASACNVLADRPAALQQSSQEAEQEEQATAWAVVRCLPRLEAALPLMLAMTWWSGTASSPVAKPFPPLLKQPIAIKGLDSCLQLQQLLAGADAAQRIVVALAPAVAGQEAEAADAALDTLAPFLQHCSSLAHSFFSSAAGGQPVTAAQLPAAVSAAVQLHADGCRLVHRFIAAGHTAGTLLRLASAIGDTSIIAMDVLLASLQTSADDARIRLTALIATTWEATQLLVASLGPAARLEDTRLLGVLAAELAWIAGHAPPSMLIVQPQLLEQLIGTMKQALAYMQGRNALELAETIEAALYDCARSTQAVAALLDADVWEQTALLLRLPPVSRHLAYRVADLEHSSLLMLSLGADAAAAQCTDSSLQAQLHAAAVALPQALPAPMDQPEGAAVLRQLARLADLAPQAKALAALLRQHWSAQARDPAVLSAARLELARAAATRDCANLRCPHFCSPGRRGKKCTGCRSVRYCCQECNVAGWRAGHKHVCAMLAAERQ